MSTERWAIAQDVSAVGSGVLSDTDVLKSFIFRAGVVASAAELIAAFYADDLGRLDWLGDYVLDRGLLQIADFIDEPELEDEPMFNKKDMPAGSGDALYDS